MYELKFEKLKLNFFKDNIVIFDAELKPRQVDAIKLNGKIFEIRSFGKMTFLFHDPNIDLKLKDQEKGKNSVLSFAANPYLNNSPVKAGQAPKVVTFMVERAMNKGFLNVKKISVFRIKRNACLIKRKRRKR